MKKNSVYIFLLTIALCIQPLNAHHGGALDWNFESQKGPVSGVVTEFKFAFPHIQVYFDSMDEEGVTSEWVVGTRWTPTVMRKHGWSRNTIKPGDEISVIYFPHVSRQNTGTIIRMEVNGEHLETNVE